MPPENSRRQTWRKRDAVAVLVMWVQAFRRVGVGA